MGFNNPVKFLNDYDPIDLGGKVADELLWKGIDQSKFEIAGIVTKDFPCVLIGGAGGNDTQTGIAHLHPVD